MSVAPGATTAFSSVCPAWVPSPRSRSNSSVVQQEIEIEPVGLELLQDRLIPVEVEFPDPVVRDRQGPGLRIRGEVQVPSAHHDQLLAVRLDHAGRDAQPLGDLEGLVPGNEDAVAVREHRAAGPILTQGGVQQGPAAGRAAVGVAGVELQVLVRADPGLGRSGARRGRR